MFPDDAALQRIARLLPRSVRERVFEPALMDLRVDEACDAGNAARRWRARAVLLAECFGLGIVEPFWRRGRPTRLTIALMGMLAVVAVVVQRFNYAHR